MIFTPEISEDIRYFTHCCILFHRLKDRANQIVAGIKTNTYEDLNYYVSLGRKFTNFLMYEKRVSFYTLDELRRMAATYNQPELETEMEQKLQEYAGALNLAM